MVGHEKLLFKRMNFIISLPSQFRQLYENAAMMVRCFAKIRSLGGHATASFGLINGGADKLGGYNWVFGRRQADTEHVAALEASLEKYSGVDSH